MFATSLVRRLITSDKGLINAIERSSSYTFMMLAEFNIQVLDLAPLRSRSSNGTNSKQNDNDGSDERNSVHHGIKFTQEPLGEITRSNNTVMTFRGFLLSSLEDKLEDHKNAFSALFPTPRRPRKPR